MHSIILSLALVALPIAQEAADSLRLMREQFDSYSHPESGPQERSLAEAEVWRLVPSCRAESFEVFANSGFHSPARRLSKAERSLLLSAMAAPSPPALFKHLRSRDDLQSTQALRLAAFELIETHGRPREVPLCVELVRGESTLETRSRRKLARTLEDTLLALLSREPRGFDQLQNLWHRIPDEFLTATLRALGKSGTADAIEPLVSVMRSEPRAGSIALGEVGRLASALSAAERDELAGLVLFTNAHASPTVRAALTRACMALGSQVSVPVLMGLLGDADSSVVDGAHRALKALTGQNLRADQNRWESWHDAEQLWLQEQAPALLIQLRSPEDHLVQAALRELALHSFYGDQFEPSFISLLDHASTEVRTQACHVLAACAMEGALPRLLQALRFDEEPVWQAAWSALKRITGSGLPPDPSQWEALLAARPPHGL